MQHSFTLPLWKKAPFIRLIIPLVAGILLQWYGRYTQVYILAAGFTCFAAFWLYLLMPIASRFRLRWLQGLEINLLIVSLGAWVTWNAEIRNHPDWYGRVYHSGDLLYIRIDGPLEFRERSQKAEGWVEGVLHEGKLQRTRGKIGLYFTKNNADSNAAAIIPLQYGDKIWVSKPLQAIQNSGNPGAFDYRRYAAFKQVFHQVFLGKKDWTASRQNSASKWKKFLLDTRISVLATLRKYVENNKNELGIAEALLIGYTSDIDKGLRQAYSNTGVVHIIAISGMHLGLIYLMLITLTGKLTFLRYRLPRVCVIIFCLWLFALVTGGGPSVIRAAVMFTFITIGTNINKASSIYNSLAASAFFMLCYNAYFLWDVGFQLSYLAVLGIVVFQRKIYTFFYFTRKWMDKIWNLMAVSLAAQLLTFPLCVLYFHQFPNLFLLTNMLIVPLSGIVLYAEIGLMLFSPVPMAGSILGKVVTALIGLMNSIIIRVNALPFAVWDNLEVSHISAGLLYLIVIGCASWLIHKNISLLIGTMLACFVLAAVFVREQWQVYQQKKLVVYNIPRVRAIDFIYGARYFFEGDSSLAVGGPIYDYHLKPARVSLQANRHTRSLPGLFLQEPFIRFGNKRVLLIDKPLRVRDPYIQTGMDIIIISNNASVSIANLARVFNGALYVFDASNSLWKIGQWKKACEELHLRSYSVPERGAFIINAQ